MTQDERIKLISGEVDLGLEPATKILTEEQKKLTAFAMGINAALVQFILEGFIPLDQQIHFMAHLQDFVARLYAGESIKMPGTKQTLQVNSKTGSLFLEATETALTEGSKTFARLKGQWAEEAKFEDAQTTEQDNEVTKLTLH